MQFDPAMLAKVWRRTGVDADQLGVIARFGAARAQFDTYAGMDHPELPRHPTDAIQVRLFRWQSHNFGLPNPCEIACGITEELGERMVAISELNAKEIDDAVGDIQVYGCQLATARRLSFVHTVHAGQIDGPRFFDKLDISGRDLLTIAAGYINHVQLKAQQKIRDMETQELCRLATFAGLSMLMRGLVMVSPRAPLEIFEEVAEKVLRREWKRDASMGGEAAK